MCTGRDSKGVPVFLQGVCARRFLQELEWPGYKSGPVKQQCGEKPAGWQEWSTARGEIFWVNASVRAGAQTKNITLSAVATPAISFRISSECDRIYASSKLSPTPAGSNPALNTSENALTVAES